MVDPRFYSVAGPFNLEKLASIATADLQSNRLNSSKRFFGIAALQDATGKHVSFIDNRKYIQEFKSTNAGAIVVPPDLVEQAPKKADLLISTDPYKSYARIARAYHPELFEHQRQHTSALVSENAVIPNTVHLDNNVVIKDGVEIGENTSVGANTTIEKGVCIGKDSWIASNVTLAYCLIGKRAVIHAGVRIGQDGFGFAGLLHAMRTYPCISTNKLQAVKKYRVLVTF